MREINTVQLKVNIANIKNVSQEGIARPCECVCVCEREKERYFY